MALSVNEAQKSKPIACPYCGRMRSHDVVEIETKYKLYECPACRVIFAKRRR